MSAKWKNLYSVGENVNHTASDNSDDIYRLVQSLLANVSVPDGSVTRAGMIEALEIAKSVLFSPENPDSANDLFRGGGFHDINSGSSGADRGSLPPGL